MFYRVVVLLMPRSLIRRLFLLESGTVCFLKENVGLVPTFYLCRAMNMRELLEITLPGLGYELVDVELARDGLVRLFIDKPGGIGIEDCVSVSDHLTRLFLVENIAYERLEVSSPGLDRPLKKAADFERFRGHQARFQLRLPMNGLRKFQAVIDSLQGNTLTLLVDGDRPLHVDLGNIDKARLVPQIKFR